MSGGGKTGVSFLTLRQLASGERLQLLSRGAIVAGRERIAEALTPARFATSPMLSIGSAIDLLDLNPG